MQIENVTFDFIMSFQIKPKLWNCIVFYVLSLLVDFGVDLVRPVWDVHQRLCEISCIPFCGWMLWCVLWFKLKLYLWGLLYGTFMCTWVWRTNLLSGCLLRNRVWSLWVLWYGTQLCFYVLRRGCLGMWLGSGLHRGPGPKVVSTRVT